MTDQVEPTAAVPGPRHAAPRVSMRSRLRGRALAMAAVPTALLVGAAYTPTLATAATSSGAACATAPDTVLSETPVPKSELNVVPSPTATPGAPTVAVAPIAPAAAVKPAVAQASQAPTVRQADLIGDLLGGLLGGGSTPTPTPSLAPSQPTVPDPPSSPAQTPAPTQRPGAPKLPTVPLPSGAPTLPSPSGSSVTPSAGATASPSPSGSASASASPNPNCTVSTHALAAQSASGGDIVPQQNWVLHSSRLSLHGSVFNGVYDVHTTTGTKRVLKFTTDSVDIGDLDMSTIEIPGNTFHVKGAPGSTSTMRNGPITMYVESLSGDLAAVYGLPIPIPLGPITLTPDTLPQWLYNLIGAVPVPLDLTLTNAKAVQAGQFRGTLHIPGMHLYNDHSPYDG